MPIRVTAQDKALEPGKIRSLHGWFTRPSWPWIAAASAVVLTLPSLTAGWLADDHFHRTLMLRPARFEHLLGSKLDLFRFIDGRPETITQWLDVGILPWWTVRDLRAAMWRPVTSITHGLDFQLWPSSSVWMHLHGVAWLGGLVIIVGLFYRRMMGATAGAGLATLLYALDDAHGMPVGFIANRNAIIATVFGVLTLMAHDRWRKGNQWSIVLGPVLLALALLSSEAGLAATAFLFAYALWLDRGPWHRRLNTLLPYAAVVIVWRAAWSLLGYGVSPGMGLYIDPLREPAAYARALFERLSPLLLGQLALPPSDVCMALGPVATKTYALVAVGAVALLAVMFYAVIERNRLAMFWTTGALLSLLPIAATIPSDRLLFFVGLGATPLVAEFILRVLGSATSAIRTTSFRQTFTVAAYGLSIVHVVLAPIGLAFRSAFPAGPPALRHALELNVTLDPSVEKQDLIIVNAPAPFFLVHFPFIQALDGKPVPRHMRVLSSSGLPSVRVFRQDANTLVVRPEGGFLHWVFDRLFRSDRYPMPLGERVELTGMTVQVTALTDDGRPAEATFRFAVPLEDPSLRWLHWNGAFVPWTPPAVGQTVELRPRPPALWIS